MPVQDSVIPCDVFHIAIASQRRLNHVLLVPGPTVMYAPQTFDLALQLQLVIQSTVTSIYRNQTNLLPRTRVQLQGMPYEIPHHIHRLVSFRLSDLRALRQLLTKNI